MSRQRERQLELQRQGLCVKCGARRGASISQCDGCLVENRKRTRRAMGNPRAVLRSRLDAKSLREIEKREAALDLVKRNGLWTLIFDPNDEPAIEWTENFI
jgi:hypothetical protein